MTQYFQPQLVVDFLLKNKLAPGEKHVLIACFPKSGSTYITCVVSHIPNFPRAYIAAGGHADQLPRTELLALLHENRWIAQQHVCWSEYLQSQINAFGIQPVILVRNIFDVVYSLHDHIHKESIIMPMAWIEPHHKTLSPEESFAFIADMIVPWYLRFFLSW